MKSHTTLWLASFIFISSSMLYGCNQAQETSQLPKAKHSQIQEVNDEDVTSNVKTALNNNAEYKNLKITVVTTKGDVLLTGEVENSQQFEAIAMLVKTIDGVHTVHNHLLIR